VVGRQVWEHSWAPFLFAIECARILKPGGRLALETPNANDYTYESSTIHHVFCPTPFQGRKMLEKAGFVDVQALDGSNGPPKPFSDEEFGHEHRDDIGGANVTFVGTRWGGNDAHLLNPLIQYLTSRSGDGRERAIRELYLTHLGREPDREGLDNYNRSSLSLTEIDEAIRNSAEAKRRKL